MLELSKFTLFAQRIDKGRRVEQGVSRLWFGEVDGAFRRNARVDDDGEILESVVRGLSKDAVGL